MFSGSFLHQELNLHSYLYSPVPSFAFLLLLFLFPSFPPFYPLKLCRKAISKSSSLYLLVRQPWPLPSSDAAHSAVQTCSQPDS